jgi:hypothetical protein
MTKLKMLAAAAAFTLFTGAGLAAAQTQPDPHHPQQEGQDTAAPPAASPSSMMSMMGDMMKMMSGGQMQMGCMGMGGSGMADRVEGKIAFLHAELGIAAKQEKLWEAFAAAVRANADRAKKDGSAMMGGMQTGGVLEKVTMEEKQLSERLEAIRAYKSALEPLYASFDESQRRNADELLACGSGMTGQGMMGSGMMGSGMMQGMGQGQMPGGSQGAMPMQNDAQ